MNEVCQQIPGRACSPDQALELAYSELELLRYRVKIHTYGERQLHRVVIYMTKMATTYQMDSAKGLEYNPKSAQFMRHLNTILVDLYVALT